MSQTVKVLHLIDGLGGGGSERLLYDITRLSDPALVAHRVVAIHPDLGRYVYAERLREMGVYSKKTTRQSRDPVKTATAEPIARPLARGLPLRWVFRRIYHWCVYALAFIRVAVEYMSFKPSVIHAHTFDGYYAGVWLQAITKKPMIVTVPCMFSQMEAGEFGWARVSFVKHHKQVKKYFSAYPHELACEGVPEEKITPLVVAADIVAIAPVLASREIHRKRIRQELGVGDDSVIAISVGRLSPEKGHEYSIEAISRVIEKIPNYHSIILGNGPEGEKLKARVSGLRLTDRCHFLGFKEDPFPYYAAADIYLRTTIMEADNISSANAMAMGLPIVGFDTGAETELLRKVGNGILVPSRNVEEFSNAVIKIISSPDKGGALGEKGKIYCHEHFDIRNIVNKFVSAYLNAVTKDGN